MDAWNVYSMLAQRNAGEHSYEDVFGSTLLSVGLSVWPAGQPDLQMPHTEDEVYYVIAGRGAIHVAGENRAVEPGDVIFVATGVEHRFHSITETLHVLVFWAPPHGSGARD